MTNPDAVRKLEELSLSGLPALETETFDGWILRAADGYTGRANSAMPLEPGSRSLDEKLEYLEHWYRNRRLMPMLRLTMTAEPPDLERALQQRGYFLHGGEVGVCTRVLDGDDLPVDAVELTEGPVPVEWLDTLARFQPRVAEHRDTVERLFSKLPPASAFAMVRHQAEPVAIGRAVCQDGNVGLFDVFTREDLRGRGFATDVTMALLGWGTRAGAARAWLQVFAHNDPAGRLYHRLGFFEVYRYWYLAAPDRPSDLT